MRWNLQSYIKKKLLRRILVKTKLKTRPSILTKSLARITFLLVIINTVIQFLIYGFGIKKDWFLLFNMDKEVNMPTIFSCILLLICASLISLITKNYEDMNDLNLRKWNGLKWIFVFLAFDEGLQIHEAFIIPSIKPMLPAILTVVWVIPYSIFAILAIIYFMPLLKSLPRKIKVMILFSGLIYISGALGLEMIGSFLVRTGDIRLHGISYGLISTLEETLEMVGLLFFIHTLLKYIFDYQKQILKINLHISGSN